MNRFAAPPRVVAASFGGVARPLAADAELVQLTGARLRTEPARPLTALAELLAGKLLHADAGVSNPRRSGCRVECRRQPQIAIAVEHVEQCLPTRS